MRRFRGLILLFLGTMALFYFAPQRSFGVGYFRQDVPNAWVIPAGETAMNWHSDDFSWSYTLPFSFPFFGATNTSVWVSSNGLLSLGRLDSDYSNSITGLGSVRAIAPLWDDLRTDNLTGPATYNTDIYISQDSNRVMIRWRAMTFADNSTVVNFEALLASDGTIQFNYGPNNGPIDATVGISDGRGNVIANDITSSNSISSVLFTLESGKPIASFTYSPLSPLVGTVVTFNASASRAASGFIQSYNWTFGDLSPSLVETDPITNHTYTHTGTFTIVLIVRDNAGLGGSAYRTLTVGTLSQPPVASFIVNPTRALLGQPFMFNATGSYDPDGGPIVSYSWTLGDGTTATGVIVLHTYTNATTFRVILTVVDDEGSVTTSFPQSATVIAVGTSDIQLLDTYPQVRVLRLRQNPQLAFYAEAINIGTSPVYASVRFNLIDLRTSSSTVFALNSSLLDVRDQHLFQFNYVPPDLTATYLVVARLYLSGSSLPPMSPLWISTSTRAAFAFRVIR